MPQAGAKARQACRQLGPPPLPLSSRTARSRAAPRARALSARWRPPRRRRRRCCRAHTSPRCPPRCCARRRRRPGSAPRRRRTPMACLPHSRSSAGPHRTPRRRCISGRRVRMMLPCRRRSLTLCPAACRTASLPAASAALEGQTKACQHTAVCQAPACLSAWLDGCAAARRLLGPTAGARAAGRLRRAPCARGLRPQRLRAAGPAAGLACAAGACMGARAGAVPEPGVMHVLLASSAPLQPLPALDCLSRFVGMHMQAVRVCSGLGVQQLCVHATRPVTC